MKIFELEVEYSYRGYYKVKAESLAEAEEIVLRDCGMVGTRIETCNDEAVLDWNFSMHPAREII